MKRYTCFVAVLLLAASSGAQVVGGGPVIGGGGSGGTGTIGGSTGATDNVALCADGVGGLTLGVCTGQALFPAGTQAAPGIAFGTDTDTGFYLGSANNINLAAGNIELAQFNGNSFYPRKGITGAGSTTLMLGFVASVAPNTAGVGAPSTVQGYDSQVMNTNEGATAKNYRTLVTAASGYQPRFCVQDADGLRITANTADTIRVIDKVTAAAGYIESTTIGSCVVLVALNSTEWFAESIHGTWTDGTWTFDDTSLTTP